MSNFKLGEICYGKDEATMLNFPIFQITEISQKPKGTFITASPPRHTDNLITYDQAVAVGKKSLKDKTHNAWPNCLDLIKEGIGKLKVRLKAGAYIYTEAQIQEFYKFLDTGKFNNFKATFVPKYINEVRETFIYGRTEKRIVVSLGNVTHEYGEFEVLDFDQLKQNLEFQNIVSLQDRIEGFEQFIKNGNPNKPKDLFKLSSHDRETAERINASLSLEKQKVRK